MKNKTVMNELLNLELLDAVFKGRIKKVKSLLDKGLTIDEANVWGKKAMKFAIRRGQTDIMKLLYERGFYSVDSGIYASIFFDDIATLKNLLDNDIEDGFQNAFLIAVELGNIEVMNMMLIEYNVDFYINNKEGKTVFDIAKVKEQQEVIQFLSKYEYNNSQLIRACKCLKIEQVKMFLKKGANVNFKDINGEPVLTHAMRAFCKDKNAVAQRKEIVNLLLEHGARAN